MGKAKRWFRALLGAKKSPDSTVAFRDSDSRLGNEKKWALVRSPDGNNGGTDGSFTEASSSSPYVEAVDTNNKHAIAVAAATAAVAEAALAAAKAAAEVVRLTSGGSRYATAYFSRGSDRRRELAAVKIQSAFRSYLARRALRALKGLVKLQALVRGYIVRKRSTNILLRMQAMARIQARACANRTYMSESPHSSSKSSQPYHPKFGSKPNITDHVGLMKTHFDSNLFDRWMEENSWNSHRDKGHAGEEKSYKILEVDTWKPHLDPKKSDGAFQTSQHVSAWNHTEQSFTPFESPSLQSIKPQKSNSGLSARKVSTLRSLKFPQEVNQAAIWTAENSPQLIYTSSRPENNSIRGPFSPARSECSRSLFRDYLGYPNYMVNTESSWAKFRSQSTPRQRMQFEQPGSTKRFVGGFLDAETNSERGSTLHANFRRKNYPGAGCSDRPEMPVQSGATGYSSTYGSR